MTKKLKIITIVVAILLVIAIFSSIWYLGDHYPQFDATEQFDIPGLKSGFVPQGITKLDDYGLWLVSGYMADGSNSRVYLVDEKNNETKKYFTLLDNNEVLLGHYGGIASNGDDVWLVSEGVVYHFYVDDVFDVRDGHSLKVTDKFDAQTQADFCFANDEILVVGEFYKKGKTDIVGHEVARNDGMTNNAYAVAFLVGDGKYGLQTDKYGNVSPVAVYSIPNQVQGISFVNGKIVLSTSFGVTKSRLYVFDGNVGNTLQNLGKVTVFGQSVPLIALWQDKATETIEAPAMMEGIDFCNNKLYVLFESASTRYKLLCRTAIKSVVSIKI